MYNNSMIRELSRQDHAGLDGEQERYAAAFRALGDPTRLRIFEFLAGCCGPVAVRVGHPELVLPRVAADRVAFVEGGQAGILQAQPGSIHLFRRRHLDPEVVQRPLPGCARALLQRQLQRRLRQIEAKVRRLLDESRSDP